jgi:predicted transcriptional regulator
MLVEDLVSEVENRQKIFETVCKYPGIHLRELARTVDLNHNLVDYHLIYLEKRMIVYSLQDGMFKRYHPYDQLGAIDRKDRFGAPDKPVVAFLRKPIPFRIIVMLAKNEAMSHRDLTENVKRSPSTVSHHLEKLISAGIVVRLAEGGGFSLVDPQRIERILLIFTPQSATLVDGFLEIWEEMRV